MNVWNKVLMALVAVVCIAFGALAANKYQLTKDNDTNIANLEKQIEDANAKIETLRREIYGGTVDKPTDWRDYGLDEQLKYVRGLQRGAAYVNCKPVEGKKSTSSAKGDSMIASLVVDPNLYQLSEFATGSLVFLFDSGKAYVEGESSDAQDADELIADSVADSDAEAVADAVEDAVSDAVADVVGDEVADAVSEVADAAADAVSDAVVDAVADAATPTQIRPHFTFLGAFAVTGTVADSNQVKMESIGAPTEEECDALAASYRSGNSWVAYVGNLPLDSPQDVATFVEEQGVADNIDDPEFFKQVFTLDDVHNSLDATADTFVNGLADGSRFPIDFQGAIERAWATRDAANIVRKRGLVALDVLTNVIADQYVLIGRGVEDNSVLDYEDWDDVYASAQQRKKSASYAERLAKTNEELDKMNAYCDIVSNLQDAANKNLATLQKSIDYLLSENASLAAKIAFAQFAALERIEIESAKTANASAAPVDGDI